MTDQPIHPRANLWGAVLAGAHIRGADLRGAKLGSADLTGANLTEANLADTILGSAKLGGANLTRANLTDAALGGADLTGARWPEGAQVPVGWVVDRFGPTAARRPVIRGNGPLPLIAHFVTLRRKALKSRDPVGTRLWRDLTPAHYL